MKRIVIGAVIALLTVGLVQAGPASAKPKFAIKKLPGYCGTIAPPYGPRLGVSVSARDPWRKSKVTCRKALKIARTYARDVGTRGQGSGGYLTIGKYSCVSMLLDTTRRTGRVTTCSSRTSTVAIEAKPRRGKPLLPCTGKRVAAGLRGAFPAKKARLVNHRCTGETAVANVRYRGKTLRYAFMAFDNNWLPVRATGPVLAGLSGPPNRLDLAAVNGLGRAMGKKRVENRRVG